MHSYIILNNRRPFTTLLLLVFVAFSGCEKLVDIPPPINTISDEAAYSTDVSAAAVLTGIYAIMSKPTTASIDLSSVVGQWTGLNSIPVLAGLSADELYLSVVGGFNQRLFFSNSLASSISDGGKSWNPLYNLVYRCNAAIEGLNASHTLSESVKQQLLGEARFLRAYYYFYLVNLFGPVPLATTTDYEQNSMLSRSAVTDVYKQMVDDLQQAQIDLSDQFLNGSVNGPTTERTRPNKWAAAALLARVYLYMGDYANAATQAGLVLDNSTLFELLPVNEVFLKNSREAIWQLQPTTSFWNTEEAKLFILSPTAGFNAEMNPYYLNPRLVNTPEAGDARFIPGNWIDTVTIEGQLYSYAYKYKVNAINMDITSGTGTQLMTEYLMMMRLSEVYLIRAEARVQQGDLSGAIADLDKVRQRAGLPLIANTDPGINQSDLLDAILHERRVELFTEGGHRWFDLKRTGKVNEVMSVETPLKGGAWNSRETLYPLTRDELQKAPRLEQNPGYPEF
ncbi:MAG: RagB/SusD family nutrient uptake outer membrane protein [Chitinophagaceae bacterium]|nr:RagB/SusD family nutrient uptake outer membrane protein [Chitinophagaceae bacterium]